MKAQSVLRQWQTKRLEKLRNMVFSHSSYAQDLTLVIYTFPPERKEEEFFQWIECAILQSWAVLGMLKCVIIAHKKFPAVERFVQKYPSAELQIEPSLTPGKLLPMSYDCNIKLYQRFSTPNCLIIQDDGFPLRDTLSDFIGKWDYIGAPLVRTGIKRDIANFLHFATMNGGFSLRTKKFCEYASNQWSHFWSHLMKPTSSFFTEDFYYTTTMRLLPQTNWRFRFPNEKTAFRFAVDLLDGYVKKPSTPPPFGFHGKYTANYYLPPIEED